MRTKRIVVFMTVWVLFDIALSIFLSSLSSSVNLKTVVLYFLPIMFVVPVSLFIYNVKWWITYLIIVRRQMITCWLADFESRGFPKPNPDDGIMSYLQRIMNDEQQSLATRMQAAAMLGGVVNYESAVGYSKERMLMLSAEEALKQYKPKPILNDA